MRRHSRAALSARGNPANRYDCNSTSSTQSVRHTTAARASDSRTCGSVPALMIPASRTSVSVSPSNAPLEPMISWSRLASIISASSMGSFYFSRSIMGSSRFSGARGEQLADHLATGVPNACACILGQARRHAGGQLPQVAKQTKHGGILRARRAVLDLDGKADTLVEYGDGMHALGADLGDHPASGFLDDERIEAIGASEEERSRGDRA